MSSKEWKICKLKDVCIKIGSGATPRGGKESYLAEGPFALIRSQNILDFYFSYDGLAYIDKEQAYQLNNVELMEKDVLLNITGDSVARVCQVPTELLPARVNQHVCIIRPNSTKLVPEFFKYYLLNPNTKNYLLGLASVGGTRNALTKGMIEELEIKLPLYKSQLYISEILSAFDKKIELNRQTSATLEAIAQAIFKEWFVNFNFPLSLPRLEGLQDYHDYAVSLNSGYFQNQGNHDNHENQGKVMVESELGMIPKGWRVSSILEIANLLSGGTPSTQVKEYWNGHIKWISAKDVVNSQGTFILDTERKISSAGIENSNTKILPALTTIITARGSVGNYCILAEPMTMNQTNYGLKGIYPDTDYFVFFSLSNLVTQLRQASYGTIFDTITTKTFEQSKIIIPPISIIQSFEKQVASLMKKALNNLNQSTTLSSIRDELLPKLMSGEIEV